MTAITRTDKGEEELRSRCHGLSRELRHVLILVDGASSAEDLAKKAQGWDVEGGLDELARLGFIDAGGSAARNEDASAIKARMIAMAEEVLGANAGKVVEKLKAAPETAEGLKAAAESCCKMVRLIIDEKKAAALESRCRDVLEGL